MSMKAELFRVLKRQKKINWKFFRQQRNWNWQFSSLFFGLVFTLVLVSLPGQHGLGFLFNSWIIPLVELRSSRIFLLHLGKCQRRVTWQWIFMTVPNVDVVRYSINYGRETAKPESEGCLSALLKSVMSFKSSGRVCGESEAWEDSVKRSKPLALLVLKS